MGKWLKLDNAIQKGKELKLLGLGVDGVTLDGSETNGARRRQFNDGQGISLLRAAGIRIVFIGNEKAPFTGPIGELVAKWNELPSSKSGAWPPIDHATEAGGMTKVAVMERLCAQYGLTLEECGYMGNDLVACDVMERVGLAVAPANAEACVRELAHFITERDGGRGAIRDFADFILDIRGVDPRSLPFN